MIIVIIVFLVIPMIIFLLYLQFDYESDQIKFIDNTLRTLDPPKNTMIVHGFSLDIINRDFDHVL